MVVTAAEDAGSLEVKVKCIKALGSGLPPASTQAYELSVPCRWRRPSLSNMQMGNKTLGEYDTTD